MTVNLERGRILQEARSGIGRSQRWVAEQALIAERTVWRAEKGQSVSAENLQAICSVVGADFDALPPDGDEPEEESFVGPPERTRLSLPISNHVFVVSLVLALVTFGWTATQGWRTFGVAISKPIEVRVRGDYYERFSTLNHGRYLKTVARSVASGSSSDVDVAARRLSDSLRMAPPGRPHEGSYMQGIGGRAVRTPDGVLVTIGPIQGDGFAGNISRALPRSDAIRILATAADTSSDPRPGTLWADPRGLRDGEFPGGSNRQYVFFRIENKDGLK